MSINHSPLRQSIAAQRAETSALMREPMAQLAQACREVWGEREKLDQILMEALQGIPYGKFLYAVGADGIQISSNASRTGLITSDFRRDRSDRPYMRQMSPGTDYLLSDAYISLRVRRPSLTAIHAVYGWENELLGFVGADFDLRDLPLTRTLYDEPSQWLQIKGDPAIRGTVFRQSRVDSLMDGHIDTVLGVMEELMIDHGVYHGKLHFSSSRATLWQIADPFRYRLLGMDVITDPEVCLAYPRHPYPPTAVVPAEKIREVFEGLRELRFMDETLYLRAGSLNIFNGTVGLTFSCDGSHYIPWGEFLDRGHRFWAGQLSGAAGVQG